MNSSALAQGKEAKEAGGKVDVIDLPDIGIKGNTHMVMMDKNSDEVADVMQKWLASKGFVDCCGAAIDSALH